MRDAITHVPITIQHKSNAINASSLVFLLDQNQKNLRLTIEGPLSFHSFCRTYGSEKQQLSEPRTLPPTHAWKGPTARSRLPEESELMMRNYKRERKHRHVQTQKQHKGAHNARRHARKWNERQKQKKDSSKTKEKRKEKEQATAYSKIVKQKSAWKTNSFQKNTKQTFLQVLGTKGFNSSVSRASNPGINFIEPMIHAHTNAHIYIHTHWNP